MVDSAVIEKWLESLFKLKNNRRFMVLCGGEWGDGGKGSIESPLLPFFDVCVRVSGGANTGRTRNVATLGGEDKSFVFHLIPSGWADGKPSYIGDWVLIDLERLNTEIRDLVALLGFTPQAPLQISPKAPIFLPYHRFFEIWLEHCMGAGAVKTTGRGIGQIIALADLRIGPRMGHLLYPDTLSKWVTQIWDIFEDIFNKSASLIRLAEEKAGVPELDRFKLSDYTPDKVVQKLLADAEGLTHLIAFDFDSQLLDLAKKNVAALFCLTQGWGLTHRGTYPFCSSTQITAQAASYCSGVPMKYFGPIGQVGKLDPTRVGAGDGPTNMGWGRLEAEQFALDNPKLYSILGDKCDQEARAQFLLRKLERINSGEYAPVDVAMYWQVLLNELGASTGRGREVLWPDLFATACGAASNGADFIALTRLDALSGMKFDLKLGYEYCIDGVPCKVPDYPTPIERLATVNVTFDNVPINLVEVDLAGIESEEAFPPDIVTLLAKWEKYGGVPVGIASFSGGRDGKVFRNIA
ncbi:MAG: adenylosuccinate synthetase [Parcubacteria group bacterium]